MTSLADKGFLKRLIMVISAAKKSKINRICKLYFSTVNYEIKRLINFL